MRVTRIAVVFCLVGCDASSTDTLARVEEQGDKPSPEAGASEEINPSSAVVMDASVASLGNTSASAEDTESTLSDVNEPASETAGTDIISTESQDVVLVDTGVSDFVTAFDPLFDGGLDGDPSFALDGGHSLDPSCSPHGTWKIVYSDDEFMPGDDLVFVSESAERGLEATFLKGRLRSAVCESAEVPTFTEKAAFDSLTCTLELQLDAQACANFEVEINRRMLSLVVGGNRASGELEWDDFWTTGGYRHYTAEATRIATAGDCATVEEGSSCTETALCNSGCGSLCECVEGKFQCSYPPWGSLCKVGEGCSRPKEDGGEERLECVASDEQWPFFQGTLVTGTVCPPAAQLTGGSTCYDTPLSIVCPVTTGESCTCELDSNADKVWNCGSAL